MIKTFRSAGVLFGSVLCAFTFAQTGSVALKNANGTTLSTHAGIASAYAAIPVTISQGYIIEPGTSYNGSNEFYPILFTAKSGASITNTITLRPASGVTGMTIQASVATTTNGVVVFNDADHVIVDGRAGGTGPGVLTLNNISTSADANTLVFINGACFNTIRYCKLNNATTGNPGRTVFLASSTTNTLGNSYNTFQNNIFTGGRYQINSSSSLYFNTGNFIFGCEFRNSSFAAFWGQSGTAKVRIENNQFYDTTPVTGNLLRYVIVFDAQRDSAIIARNRFYDIADLSAGTLRYIDVRSINPNMQPNFSDIRNNFFSLMNGNAAELGFIRLDGARGKSLIAHNSFRMGGVQTAILTPGVMASACVLIGPNQIQANHEIRNNLIVNERSGGGTGVHHVAVDLIGTSAVTLSNNTYNTPGGDLARITSAYYTSITTYTAALANGEAGANNTPVTYAGANDLHLVCADWNNTLLMAPQLLTVQTDIDGDVRQLLTFRGADEGVGFNIIALPGCTASTGSVNISTGSGVFSYTWLPTGGSGSLATGLAPGNYTVAVSNGSCNATRTLNLAPGPPTFSISASSPSNVSCYGAANGSAAVTVVGEPGPFTYSWSPAGGNAAAASNLAPGIYSVTVSNSVSCAGTITLGITQPPAISVTILSSVPGIVCAGGQALFTATASGGTGALSYGWAGGPLTNSYSIQPNTTTVYTASAQDAYSCVVLATTTLTVNPLPTVTVNSGAICAGKSFTMVPTGAVNYTFSSGNAVVTPVANNSYTVTGTDLNACSGTTVSSVTVNPLPIITVTCGSVCAGNPFTLSPGGGITYTYSSGSNVVNPQTTTSYTVYGMDQNNCVNLAVAGVTALPRPVITVNSGSVCSGGPFALLPVGAGSYTFGGGSNVVYPVQTTTYLVTGASTNGCPGVATSTVTTVALPVLALNPTNTQLCLNDSPRKLNGFPVGGIYTGQYVAGSMFTPSGTGTFTPTYHYVDPSTGCSNTTSSTFIVQACTGIENRELPAFTIYPNPGTGEFMIVSQDEVHEVRVLDVCGREVYTAVTNDHTVPVDLHGMAAGVYYFHIAGESRLRVVKVVLQ